MLLSLSIKNYRLIEEANLDFNGGFIVVTGETGSGKTMLLSSLLTLIESRSDISVIREGEDRAIISATFNIKKNKDTLKDKLEDFGIDDDTLVLSKVIKKNGTTALINGINISQKTLKEIALELIHFSSQREQNTLLKENTALDMVDSFASLLNERQENHSRKRKLIDLNHRIEALKEEIKKTNEEKEYLISIKNEIEKANIKLGEDDEIKVQLKKVKETMLYSSVFGECLVNLNGGDVNAISMLSDTSKALLHLSAKTGSDFSRIIDELEEAMVLINDAKENIETEFKSTNLSQDEVEMLNIRDVELNRLKHKHGGSLDEVLKRYNNAKDKLNILENSDTSIEDLKRQYESLYGEYEQHKKLLYEKRIKAAKILSKKTEDILHTLDMPSAQFQIEVARGEGLNDDVATMLVSANKGEKMDSVYKISSGGELSRIFLAILTSSSTLLENRTIIFDEIDAGLGGKAAIKVKEYLKELSKGLDVLAITHEAIIAAGADEHILMAKLIKNNRTNISAKVLDNNGKEEELARLLSGVSNKETLALSKKLLSENNNL